MEQEELNSISNVLHAPKKNEEEEYVSKAHNTEPDDVDEDLPVQTIHANETRRIPSGRQGQPIKELVEIANKTDQMSKVMNFPAIDHTSPVS